MAPRASYRSDYVADFLPTKGGCVDTGNTAFVLAAAGLVLFMTPGLAFFYGGMVRSKNVLGMLMQNFFAMGLVAVVWSILGFTLAFGGFGNAGLLGDLSFFGMHDVTGAVRVLGEGSSFGPLALT